MVQKIKNIILAIVALFIFTSVPAVVMAAPPVSPAQGACAGATKLQIGTGGSTNDPGTEANCKTNGEATSKINNLISTVLNVLSAIIGVISVIMIIIGGFHYVTSGGNQEKVTKAKNTLLYAVIGLIIAALAQIIVQFVLNKTANI